METKSITRKDPEEASTPDALLKIFAQSLEVYGIDVASLIISYIRVWDVCKLPAPVPDHPICHLPCTDCAVFAYLECRAAAFTKRNNFVPSCRSLMLKDGMSCIDQVSVNDGMQAVAVFWGTSGWDYQCVSKTFNESRSAFAGLFPNLAACLVENSVVDDELTDVVNVSKPSFS